MKPVRRSRHYPLAIATGVLIVAVLMWLHVHATSPQPVGAISPTVSPSFIKPAAPASRVEPPTSTAPNLLLPIITYHYIAPPPPHEPLPGLYTVPAQFKQQLDALTQAGYHFGRLRDLESGWQKSKLDRKLIILTFDDGYQDFYTTAWPVLRERQIPATIYLVSGFLDTPGHLTTSEVKELADSPLITVGAHTVDHKDLSTLAEAAEQAEIVNSKQTLEAIIGRPVIDFCYPSGKYTTQTLQLVARDGFVTATTTHRGVWHSRRQPLELTRLEAQNLSGAALVARLTTEARASQPAAASPAPSPASQNPQRQLQSRQ